MLVRFGYRLREDEREFNEANCGIQELDSVFI